VPELNATNTVARLVPEILVFDFIDFTEVESKFRVDSAFTSSNPDIRFRYAGNGGIVKWDGSQEDPILSLLDPQHWIPGDTLRLHVSIFHTMRGTNTVAAQGKVKVRYEHRITLPAPSASLSLPLGAAWLAGLSMMKGGA
jgi:hypothetical protein